MIDVFFVFFKMDTSQKEFLWTSASLESPKNPHVLQHCEDPDDSNDTDVHKNSFFRGIRFL